MAKSTKEEIANRIIKIGKAYGLSMSFDGFEVKYDIPESMTPEIRHFLMQVELVNLSL